MTIFRFEMKRYLKSMGIWAFSLALMQLTLMSFFPTMANEAALMDMIMEHYPKELLQAFGMGEYMSFSTALGYYTFVFVFVQLCLAIQSSYYGFNFLSIEERELTADFLFTKPLKRIDVLVQKYLAVVVALVLTNCLLWLTAFMSIMLFKGDQSVNLKPLMWLLLSTPIFQWVFLSIGLLVTALSDRIRSVLSYAMGLSFSLYILNAVRGVVGGTLLGVISPYYHFEAAYIIDRGHWPLDRLWLPLLMIVVCHIMGILMYIKRDIRAL
jgi:ABC-2 type transport system permease protein